MTTISKVKLRSSDSEIFHVNEQVANQSGIVKNLIEDVGPDAVIPLPNVEGKILAMIIQYCEYHVESKMSSDDKPPIPEDEVKQWDAKFVIVDEDTLFSLILAANYLNIKNLLDLTCQAMANMIAPMTPEEIRKKFDIMNDFTPEEEAEVRRENEWALK